MAIWDFYGIRAHRRYETVLGRREMPGAVWFPGTTLNYAEHAVEPDGDAVAIVAYSQIRDRVDLTWAELRDRVTRARVGLQRLGRTELSPRHTPDSVIAVPAIPRNRTGKKLELPVKKVLLGAAPDEVASREVLADPSSMDFFVRHAGNRR